VKSYIGYTLQPTGDIAISRICRFLTAIFLTTGRLALSAQAMSFPQFDSMSTQDRQNYMGFLVQAAQTAVINLRQKDNAGKNPPALPRNSPR
jgi:hypothetical protein